MNGVAVIAQMNIDMLFSGFPGYPALGEEVFAQQFDIQLGGGPQVIPIQLARMDIPVKLGTFLADDTLSRLSRQLLAEMHFANYHNLYKGTGRPVVITSVFSFPTDRAFIAYNQQASDKDLSDDAVYDFLKGNRVCFAPQSEAVLKKLKRDGTITVFDTCWNEHLRLEDLEHILRYADVFTPNDKEAMHITGTDNVSDALRRLGEAVRYPVVKIGKGGCVGLIDGEEIRVSAVDHLVPVDTTGAGDNFLAGMIYGLYHGWSPVRCMQMANVVGGYSTTALGCFKAGITGEKALELMEYYEA